MKHIHPRHASGVVFFRYCLSRGYISKFNTSTLLSIDALDIRILRQINIQFLSNINSGATHSKFGVEPDVLSQLLRGEEIDSIMIGRSIQRLISQDLIREISLSKPTIREQEEVKKMMEGKSLSQQEGSLIVTDYGRRFLRFLNLDTKNENFRVNNI